MPIAFKCPGCGKSFSVADGLAGKQAKCNGCGAAITVPAAAAPQAAKPAAARPAPAQPAAKPDSDDPFADLPPVSAAPVRRPRPPAEDEAAPSKPPPKKAKAAQEPSQAPLVAHLIRYGIGLCVLAGLVFAFMSILNENRGRRVVIGDQGPPLDNTPINEKSGVVATTPPAVSPPETGATPPVSVAPVTPVPVTPPADKTTPAPGGITPAPDKLETHVDVFKEMLVLMEAERAILAQVTSDSAAEAAIPSLEALLARAAAVGAALKRLGPPAENDAALKAVFASGQSIAEKVKAEVERVSDNYVWSAQLAPVTGRFGAALFGEAGGEARMLIVTRKMRVDPAVQSHNQMKQLILAFHNYESSRRKLPTNSRDEKTGKPLLSWRVQILPYVEQTALYQKFNFEKPWDDPENLALAKTIPGAYVSPLSKLGKEGKTTYLMVGGPGTLLEPKEAGFGDISDGSDKTAVLVEVSDDRAVFWTKPDDFEFNPAEPARGLTGLYPNQLLVGIADGRVLFLPDKTPAETLKSLFLIKDGGPAALPEGATSPRAPE